MKKWQDCYSVCKHRELVRELGILKQLLYAECDLVGYRTISLFPSPKTANQENKFFMSGAGSWKEE